MVIRGVVSSAELAVILENVSLNVVPQIPEIHRRLQRPAFALALCAVLTAPIRTVIIRTVVSFKTEQKKLFSILKHSKSKQLSLSKFQILQNAKIQRTEKQEILRHDQASKS